MKKEFGGGCLEEKMKRLSVLMFAGAAAGLISSCGDAEGNHCQVEATIVYDGAICNVDAFVKGEGMRDYLVIPDFPITDCETYPSQITDRAEEEISVRKIGTDFYSPVDRLEDGRLLIRLGFPFYDCSQ